MRKITPPVGVACSLEEGGEAPDTGVVNGLDDAAEDDVGDDDDVSVIFDVDTNLAESEYKLYEYI